MCGFIIEHLTQEFLKYFIWILVYEYSKRLYEYSNRYYMNIFFFNKSVFVFDSLHLT